jgi:hypothetical protein
MKEKKAKEIIESHNLGTYEVRRTNLHKKSLIYINAS